MSNTLCKRILTGSILAVLAAGGVTLPAAGKQSTSASTSKKAGKSTASSAKPATGVKAKSTVSKTASKSSTATKASTRTTRSTKSRSRSKTKKVKGQAAPTPDRINEIQEALARNGAYTGELSGKWDDSTADAMKKFQAKHGLNPTGKLDAPTLQKLGLGSETAGLAAPTPPPNSAANRLLSPAAKRDESAAENEDQ